MADYYPILASAVSSLPTNNAQARQELYERARTILDAQLRRRDAQRSTPETMGERVAFEMAILKVEAESLSMRERSPETFADYVPLHANDKIEIPSGTVHELYGDKKPDDGKNGWVPDLASLLREAAEAPPAPAQVEEIGASKKEAANATKGLGVMPKLLGLFLLSIAFMMVFFAIIYIRDLAKF